MEPPTEVKEQHGTDIDVLVSASAEVDNGLGSNPGQRSNQVVRQRESLATVILSVGLAAALLEFIYLSFLLPDAGNIIIPLILTPIIRLLNDRWQNRKKE